MQKETRSITHLFSDGAQKGAMKGTCILCGIETEHGHKPKFSQNFTGYSFLYHGSCLCPECNHFFKNQKMRNKMWIITEDGITFLKKQEVLSHLLNPPEKPFAIYITKSFKKQGWLSGINLVSRGRKFFILTDFVGNVFTNKDEVKSLSEIILELRKEKVPKQQIASGQFSMSIYRKLLVKGKEQLMEKAKANAGKDIWEVLVYVAQ